MIAIDLSFLLGSTMHVGIARLVHSAPPADISVYRKWIIPKLVISRVLRASPGHCLNVEASQKKSKIVRSQFALMEGSAVF